MKCLFSRRCVAVRAAGVAALFVALASPSAQASVFSPHRSQRGYAYPFVYSGSGVQTVGDSSGMCGGMTTTTTTTTTTVSEASEGSEETTVSVG